MTKASDKERSGAAATGPESNSGQDRLSIARAAYDSVPFYDPKRSPVTLDLTDNTNLWGLPPAAERVIRDFAVSSVTRYPSLYAADLKQALAEYIGVDSDMIVTGNGSDDILDSGLRAIGNPDELVVGSDPSFVMIPIFAKVNSLRWQSFTELPSHQPDIDRMLAANPKILYLCSPNNPTGSLIAREIIERAVSECSGAVFIDEAYAEFAGVSSVDLTAKSDRVLIIRTMSKAFGLAGLRVGYGIGQPALVREVEKSRGPYKLNALAEQATMAALKNDVGWVNEHVALAVSIRQRLNRELKALGFSAIESHSNFLCFPIEKCVEVGAALRSRGVAVRPFPGLPHIGDTMRISVGPWEFLETFLEAFVPSLREVHG